jgi:glutamate formiminotransferase/formiminotetrahydrofolate cyclodeaminase
VHEELHRTALETLASCRTKALALADEDQAAYQRLNTLWKLDADDEQRRREMPDAARAAADVPARVIRTALEMLELFARLQGTLNRNLLSDLAIATVLAESAARSASWMVRVNLPLLDDEGEAERIERECGERLERAADLREELENSCRLG